ncbi:MAG: hypothetical protein AABW81_01965 [Nanoarchaeota archaeon]
MSKKISKAETKDKIDEFFKEIKNKSPKEIKKIKKLGMKHNISLKEKRKDFCKKCFMPYKNPKIRINNKIKSVTCKNCGLISRWKMN